MTTAITPAIRSEMAIHSLGFSLIDSYPFDGRLGPFQFLRSWFGHDSSQIATHSTNLTQEPSLILLNRVQGLQRDENLLLPSNKRREGPQRNRQLVQLRHNLTHNDWLFFQLSNHLVLATNPGEPLQPERPLVSYHVEDGTVLILTAIGGGV